MRVLICGSRHWQDRTPIVSLLSGMLLEAMRDGETLTIIEGGAGGADALARQWYGGEVDGQRFAVHDDVKHETYEADWACGGRAAGPLRNQRMLRDGKPDVVYAFRRANLENRGTDDMIRRATKAGVPVYVIENAVER